MSLDEISNAHILPEKQIELILQTTRDNVKEQLLEKLLSLNPFQFEEFIGYYFEAENYQNVEVTSRSNDGGIDVVAEAYFGIIKVRLGVQVKRFQPNRKIDRNVVDMLRGSLYRIQAEQGVIITTSSFTKKAIEAAQETKPSIILISGDILLEKLIDQRIGIKTKKYGLLYLDESFFELGFSDED
jgi:restriction system protein